ncbi:hypothetical protein HN51_029123 [Arachis hypogaea]|uniref:Receptor-like serine/threonine-protein kinase At4g25390 isoform X2 n=2 Tax=Arachis TaxID=3817 RepID=A0A6P5MVL0_ARADU|nr:receptor-like serine/threonine-protein kinase At4g25390 isoform X2 [Arachis duranensis]XP_015941459.1 receptor-like serine/threonine-protein kinase At4g25390 isoform X2 [Arachis duranensis]XP_025620205.1 receptor-like serine/threonine-protein kinase At4g25390 isoform X1 [Arachis hypogaea]XP_025620206.1 receptor-like serine/threonine-protein kinase At4g25390 isoform X1 [Arachis hypogaea]XP_025620207.1 receptor-like serine/threonine-protein kinase At4g25390 isoform X1 [Arachis hypogaea]XP_025
MPSRHPSTSSPPNKPQNHFFSSASSFFVFFFLCLRNPTRKKNRTTPSSDSDSNPPHRFSYSLLRRATNSFSTILGHGGFGPVFSASLAGKPLAVKLMDSSASLQGEREFHNELLFASRLLRSSSSSTCRHVVPAIGFASDPKRRRFLIVYDLMHNGNLHDALLRRKSPELMRWQTRFSVALDVARGLQFLHSCDPPVIHGDIKPSNVLLDRSFAAKIGDFGLAKFKTENRLEAEALGCESDGASVFEEQSPERPIPSPDAVVKKNGKGVGGNLVNEENGGSSGAVLKDYVMDWIGNDVGMQRPKAELTASASAASTSANDENNNKKKKNKSNSSSSRRKLEWWESMDEDGDVLKKQRRRPVREWWKEEYSQELASKKKKKNKKKKEKDRNGAERESDEWWFREIKKSGSRNSVDSWVDDGEIPKSGAMSSNQSMRGTVFYVAPECGGDASEKCDVYSFGVLLLVIVSGRRPLEVTTGSPLSSSEFQRANLVSWGRHCSRKGKLLDLVDESIQGLDKEQALLCIKVALLCLLKSPSRRPSMKEVVGMLSGELEPSQLPLPYSSSSST